MAATSEELSAQAEQLQSSMAFFHLENGQTGTGIPSGSNYMQTGSGNQHMQLLASACVKKREKKEPIGVGFQLHNDHIDGEFERF